MDWYWYVLIGVGVVGIAFLKLYFFKQMQMKKQERLEAKKRMEEEE